MNENKDNSIEVIDKYMDDANAYDLLTIEEERALFVDMKDEKSREQAREKLIKSNLRLVVKIANQYRGMGLDFPDLINEGNIGLMTAVDKFDAEKGAKLSYYASFWIKQTIRRSISNKGRTIRLPVATVDAKLKIHKYIEEYELENHRTPSVKEISKAVKIPVKKINKLLKLNFQQESLNAKIGDDEDSDEVGDVLTNESAISPFLLTQDKDENEVLSKFLSDLSSRQRYIIIRRFGLNGSKPETLETIGKKFNLTRERIRQLELVALRALRDMYKKINKNKVDE